MMQIALEKAQEAKNNMRVLNDLIDRVNEKLKPQPKRRPTDAQMLHIRSIHEC